LRNSSRPARSSVRTSPCAAWNRPRSTSARSSRSSRAGAFEPGLKELIVGRGVAAQFQGAGLGQTLRMRGSEWTVVGIFESGDANESELWADVEVAQSAFARQGYSSIRLQLADAKGLQTVKDALTADPR
jgi:putative ABC transport system permease protein